MVAELSACMLLLCLVIAETMAVSVDSERFSLILDSGNWSRSSAIAGFAVLALFKLLSIWIATLCNARLVARVADESESLAGLDRVFSGSLSVRSARMLQRLSRLLTCQGSSGAEVPWHGPRRAITAEPRLQRSQTNITSYITVQFLYYALVMILCVADSFESSRQMGNAGLTAGCVVP